MINPKHWSVSKWIAHRGASKVAPENTLAALFKARELGARWVEADVRLTRDGEAIIFHDATLNRCTNGRGLVSRTAYQMIAGLDAGSWFGKAFVDQRVPTLDQWLQQAAELGLGIILDLKMGKRGAKRLADHVGVSLARYWRPDLPIPLIASESVPCLQALASQKMGWHLGYMVSNERGRWPAVVNELDCVSVHIDHRRLSERWIKRLKEQGIAIAVYTVNDPARAAQLFAWGVDSLFTDDLFQT